MFYNIFSDGELWVILLIKTNIMASLLCNPLFWVAVIPSILLIAIVALMVRHRNAIENLNRQLSNFDGNIHVEHDVNSIRNYVRIIAYIAIAFCVGVAIHYLAVELPRILNNDYTNSHLHNLGVDYLGLIVAIFAIIVTLLVGWQIFSNIQERNRIDRFARDNEVFHKNMMDFRNGLDGQIKELKECCEVRGEQIKNIDEKVDAHINATLLVLSSEALIKGIDTKSKLSLSDALRVSIAYSSLLRAILQFVQTKGKIENVRGCISKLKTCLLLFWDNSKFDKSQYDECTKLYNEIVIAISTHTQYSSLLDEIKEANEWRTKIGWDEDAERMHEYLKKLEKGDTPQPSK